MVAMAATKVGMGSSPPMVTRVAMASEVAMVEVRLPTVVVAVAMVAELPCRDLAAARTQTREPSLSETSASLPRRPRSPMSLKEIDSIPSESECCKIRMENSREPPSSNSTRRKTQRERADLMAAPWSVATQIED